jgi:hypothetical protein
MRLGPEANIGILSSIKTVTSFLDQSASAQEFFTKVCCNADAGLLFKKLEQDTNNIEKARRTIFFIEPSSNINL